MKILKAKYILTCDDDFQILENKSIVFDEKIVKIGDFSELVQEFSNAEIFDYSDCVAMPGLINTHTHLEYSANVTNLAFGDFIEWLKSVILNRNELSQKATTELISKKLNEIRESGTTCIGEISSFGVDLKACANADIRVVFFNEILGTNETNLKANFDNFLERLNASLNTAKKEKIDVKFDANFNAQTTLTTDKNAKFNAPKSNTKQTSNLSKFLTNLDENPVQNDANPSQISADFSTQNDDIYSAHSSNKQPKFIPAISIHSPYSTHPNLAHQALKIAREENLLVSTHFLESIHEKKWLKKGSGKFAYFLGSFNPNARPLYTQNSFLAMFAGIKTLFTHCVFVENFAKFDPKFHSIAHCVFSNRLLGQKCLNLKKVRKNGLKFSIGTDGLSSNISLNLWDELRANLLAHPKIELNKLAKMLLIAATKDGANALNLDAGEIKIGKIADIGVFDSLDVKNPSQLALQLILHTKKAQITFIGGQI